MAEQLELSMSLTDAATLRQDHVRMAAYCRAMYDENAQLRAQVAQLKQDNAAWARSYKTLKAERDALTQTRLNDAEHPLHQECTRLRRELDVLRDALFQKTLAELSGMRRQASPLDKQAVTTQIKRALTRIHPDVSHDKTGPEVAHEATVVLTKLLGEVAQA